MFLSFMFAFVSRYDYQHTFNDIPLMCNVCVLSYLSVVNAVQFHPDDTCVVSGSADRSIKVWDVRSHQLIQHYLAHSDAVTSVAMHPVSECLSKCLWVYVYFCVHVCMCVCIYLYEWLYTWLLDIRIVLIVYLHRRADTIYCPLPKTHRSRYGIYEKGACYTRSTDTLAQH